MGDKARALLLSGLVKEMEGNILAAQGMVLQPQNGAVDQPEDLVSCETWAPACESVRSRDGTLFLSSTGKPLLVTALNMKARASKIASLQFGDTIG